MRSKLFITIIAVCFMKFGAIAQTTSVQILDLLATPLFNSGQTVTDSIEVLLQFKINNSELASKVHVLFGTAQDSGDIKTIQAVFLSQTDTVFISYNGNSIPVTNYTASLKTLIPASQSTSENFITLYVEDTGGLFSDRLYYYKIQQPEEYTWDE